MNLEKNTLNAGTVYDCKIRSYGNEKLVKGIYLGKNFGCKKQLHGLVFKGGTSYVNLIKFSKIFLWQGILEISNPRRIYGLNEQEEMYYKNQLKQRGLIN
jgi:hypothetical protein